VRTLIVALLIAAWLGAALLVAGSVAPAAFAVLPSRTMAGALVGRILPVVFLAGVVAGLCCAAVAATGTMSLGRWRVGSGLALAASCAIAQFVVTPRIERIRASIGGAVDALDPADPRRVAFGQLHLQSVAWLGVAILAAVVALVAAAIAVERGTAPRAVAAASVPPVSALSLGSDR